MNIIKLEDWKDIPREYTGIVEGSHGIYWYKNGLNHREDGPAYVEFNGYKSWWLDGKVIWISNGKLDLTNKIILSKSQHPLYPTVQVWKILNKNEVYEQIIIS